LRIGPYKPSPREVLTEFVEKYWGWFAFAALLLVLAVMHVARTEYLVRLRTRELKESQEKAQLRLAELAHVSRQVTLGELANGLAHEINQPLGAIANYAAGCVRAIGRGAQPQTLEEPLREISRQAEHAGRILKNIRNYVRNRFDARALVDVNSVLTDAVSLLGAEIRKSGVTVETDFAPGLPRVRADRVGLEQVAVNLIRNAIEAMREQDGAPRRLKISTAVEGGRAAVTISDSGPGLPEEERKRLFEPFRTSKEKGLGLGLSISRSIIHNHGGMIMARQGELGGLSITFTLPIGAEQDT
jgi:two-component system sensor histidine kinase TtrS